MASIISATRGGCCTRSTEWKQSSGGLLVIMFHEIWTFWPVLNKNYLVQQLHRRDLRQLLQRADAVFTSTAGQAEHLRALAPEKPVDVLPVGSNIGAVAGLTGPRTPGLAVLFGLQGSRMSVLSKMQDQLKALAASGCLRKIVTIGGGATADGVREERTALEAMELADGFQQRGELREDEVSQQLAKASFALSAQDELSVTKSGTFMAYAAHRLNIISPFASRSATEPLCWATHPEELVAGISDQEIQMRAAKLHDWQERTCSWPRIADQFAQALQLDASSAAG